MLLSMVGVPSVGTPNVRAACVLRGHQMIDVVMHYHFGKQIAAEGFGCWGGLLVRRSGYAGWCGK